MKQYQRMLEYVLTLGVESKDRTGVGTISTFGYQAFYDLRKGFPLLTTKRLYWKGIVHELLWFLRGDTNVKYLHEHDVHIWDEWASTRGDLGPIYGKQWRAWPDYHGGTIDQIQNVISQIKENPFSRRHIVSAWNVAQIDEMALPPCHLLFQFYVRPMSFTDKVHFAMDYTDVFASANIAFSLGEEKFEEVMREHGVNVPYEISLQLYQRSADVFLGVPFNIASYSLLLMMVAQLTGTFPKYFIHSIGDLHLYSNHVKQARELLSRTPKELPIVYFENPPDTIDGFTEDNIVLLDYDPHPPIHAPVAV